MHAGLGSFVVHPGLAEAGFFVGGVVESVGAGDGGTFVFGVFNAGGVAGERAPGADGVGTAFLGDFGDGGEVLSITRPRHCKA